MNKTEKLFVFIPHIVQPIDVSVYINFGVVDLIIISFIPIWIYPLYHFSKKINWVTVLSLNFITALSVIFILIFSIILLRIINNPYSFIPEYLIILPFNNFWTMVFTIGIGIPHLFNIKNYINRQNLDTYHYYTKTLSH